MNVRLPARVRSLRPHLSRDLWIYQAGALVDSFGRGMTAPFVFIYLTVVRDFGPGTSGAVMGTFAAAGLVGTFGGGVLADRAGARPVLISSLALVGASYAGLALVERPRQAFVAMALSGLGFGAFRTSNSAAIAHLAGDRAHLAFSVSRMADNAGLGLGGLTGGLIATTAEPETFTAIFLIDAVTSLSFGLFAALALRRDLALPGGGAPSGGRGGYRVVLAQRAIVALALLNAAYVCLGYAMFETALPIFVKEEVGLGEGTIGLLFLVNTLAVALLQLPLSHLVARRRRLTVLAAIGVTWSVAWAGATAVGLRLSDEAALGALVVVVIVFAVGECGLPVVTTLVAELAPPGHRARALGLLPASYALGLMVGPTLIGLGLGVTTYGVWVAATVALVAASAAAFAVERVVPQEHRVAAEEA